MLAMLGEEHLNEARNMLLPVVGVVVLIIGIVIPLLNPDPATTNLEIARNATNYETQLKRFLLIIKPMHGCIP